jgi:hypothetical protein
VRFVLFVVFLSGCVEMMSVPYTNNVGEYAPRDIQAKCEDLGRKASVLWVRQTQVEADCMLEQGYTVK